MGKFDFYLHVFAETIIYTLKSLVSSSVRLFSESYVFLDRKLARHSLELESAWSFFFIE